MASSGLLLEGKWSWWALSSFFSLGLIFFIYVRDIGGTFWFALSLVLLLTDRPSHWKMRSTINIEPVKEETVLQRKEGLKQVLRIVGALLFLFGALSLLGNGFAFFLNGQGNTGAATLSGIILIVGLAIVLRTQKKS
ncbi:MAG: hypothetical protein HY755_08930 [Nitrospirae bacterium]|nr:hypothetical protein [Nitrospirota bacterium]